MTLYEVTFSNKFIVEAETPEQAEEKAWMDYDVEQHLNVDIVEVE